MTKLIHTILGRILELLFPEQCLSCKKKGEIFCQNCLAAARHKGEAETSLPFLDHLYVYGMYENKYLREALRRFKYHGTYGLANPFSHMLYELIKPHLSGLEQSTLILSIPIAPERRRSRGYNQAELLAKALSEKISLKTSGELLRKIRSTPSQTSLSGQERILNVKNSFAVTTPEEIAGKKIILVDDIVTTGATLSETARVLKEAGAKEVIGLVVARS